MALEDCFYDPYLDDMEFVLRSMIREEEDYDYLEQFMDVNCKPVKTREESQKYVPSGYEFSAQQLFSQYEKEVQATEIRLVREKFQVEEVIDWVEIQDDPVVDAEVVMDATLSSGTKTIWKRFKEWVKPSSVPDAFVVEYSPVYQEFSVRRHESIVRAQNNIIKKLTGTTKTFRKGKHKLKGYRRYVGYPLEKRKTFEGYELPDPPDSF